MKLSQLASELGCELLGKPDLEVAGVAGLEEAGPSDLSFLADARQAARALASRAGALVIPAGWTPPEALPCLRAPEPEVAFARAVELLRPAWRPAPGVDPSARIHPSAEIGAGAHVGAFVAIGEHCRLGPGAVIHPHAVIYPNVTIGARLVAHAHVVIREGTVIGDDVTLQPGVVIGGDGFGFARRRDGSYAKIPQVGRVEIGSRVEIQSNSCIDRGSLHATRIGDGSKIDNLTQVAHNCELAEDVVLCAQVGLAGSTRIETGAILAGQVGVAGHCTIGKGTIITAQSGTHGDLEAGKMYSGSPAFDHADWLRSTATFAKLGELQRQVRQLRQKLERESR